MNLKDLNTDQISAVEQEGNVLLTACPGSGKTRVIIYKLAYELSKLEPDSKKKIIALTFTVRASEEIFRRLNNMGVACNSIWSGTLHAFCFEWIIRPYSCYLEELQNGYSIADESYCNELLSDLKKKYNLGINQNVCCRINRDGCYVESRSTERKVVEEYHNILKSNRLIDFELLLYNSYKILQKFPKICEILSNIIPLICVDEYQDTQDLLYAILAQIVKARFGETRIFFVGDTDQAIYSSFGGSAKTAEEISKEIGNQIIKHLTLTGNYRTCQRIVNFYMNFQNDYIDVISTGENAEEQGLITYNDKIHVQQLEDEIIRLILLSLNAGIPESEICILVPQWWLVTSMTKSLRSRLPNVSFDASGLSPMSSNRNNIWYKLARLILTQPSPNIYSTRYRWAGELIDDFQNITDYSLDDKYCNARTVLKIINQLDSDEEEGMKYLDECFNKFMGAISLNYFNHPALVQNREQYFKTVEKRLEDPQFKIPSDIESFKSFYREMNGIVISTCAGIKGEEFETVIAYALLEGYLPHWSEIYNNQDSATISAKKLMYVICSRAKTRLHLISERGRQTRRGVELKTSRVLNGITFKFDSI